MPSSRGRIFPVVVAMIPRGRGAEKQERPGWIGVAIGASVGLRRPFLGCDVAETVMVMVGRGGVEVLIVVHGAGYVMYRLFQPSAMADEDVSEHSTRMKKHTAVIWKGRRSNLDTVRSN